MLCIVRYDPKTRQLFWRMEIQESISMGGNIVCCYYWGSYAGEDNENCRAGKFSNHRGIKLVSWYYARYKPGETDLRR